MTSQQNVSRRTIAKGAAWSVPVVAVAAAAPAASASTTNASLTWSDSSTSLLTLALLDGGGTLTAQALVTVPTQLTITNGAGAISGENATVTITVARPAGINIPVGQARGFGVASYNGSASVAGERTATYRSALGVKYGFPLTTFSRTVPVSIAPNGTLNVPVTWGLAGVSTGVAISLLARFGVTATVAFADKTLSASSSISVPVGAGIL